jgi:predicted PurR-regulated permease PerM
VRGHPAIIPAERAPVLEPPIAAGALVQQSMLTRAAPYIRLAARWLLVALAIYVVCWLLWSASPALLPFVIGLILAYLLLPLVNLLDRSMPRWLAILLVYLGGIGAIAGSIAYIAPPVADQIEQLIDSIPSVDRLQELGNTLLQQYRSSVPESIRQPFEEGIRNALTTARANIGSYITGTGEFLFSQVLRVLNTVTFLVGFLIIPIWMFYILNDQDKGRAFIDRLLHPRIRADFWNILGITNQVMSDYIRGQLILGVAVGVMVGVGLLLLQLLGFHVPYILLLSIIAGITELIPIIGPVLGAVPGVLLGFFVDVPTGLAVLVVYIVVQQLENNFLVPRIIGESVGIHPAILTVVLIAMGQVYGLLGVILAAPLSAIGRDLFVYIYRRLGGLPADAARASVRDPIRPKAAPT